MHERQRIVKEQRAILRDHAIHDDDPDHGIDIDGVIHEEEEEKRADQSERQREHADERGLHRFIEDREDHVHEEHPHEKR